MKPIICRPASAHGIDGADYPFLFNPRGRTFSVADSSAYRVYREWCNRIGVEAAGFAEWGKVNRSIGEQNYSFPMM